MGCCKRPSFTKMVVFRLTIKRIANRLKPLISEEMPAENEVYEESSVMLKAPYCCWDSQAPRKIPKDESIYIPKDPKKIIPGIFYQTRSKQDHPKRRGPKTLLSTKNDGTQKMQKHPLAPVQPLIAMKNP